MRGIANPQREALSFTKRYRHMLFFHEGQHFWENAFYSLTSMNQNMAIWPPENGDWIIISIVLRCFCVLGTKGSKDWFCGTE
jgi:hypothetical protein